MNVHCGKALRLTQFWQFRNFTIGTTIYDINIYIYTYVFLLFLYSHHEFDIRCILFSSYKINSSKDMRVNLYNPWTIIIGYFPNYVPLKLNTIKSKKMKVTICLK